MMYTHLARTLMAIRGCYHGYSSVNKYSNLGEYGPLKHKMWNLKLQQQLMWTRLMSFEEERVSSVFLRENLEKSV